MKRIVLRNAIDRKPRAADFILVESEMPSCPKAGILVRTLYLSLDPYVGSRLRGRHMGEPPPQPMKGAIPGAIIGEVIESDHPGFRPGDRVQSMEGGWQEYADLPPGTFRRIDGSSIPLSAHLGVLGMPGLTGWAGINELARVQEGDVVLIDAAAGAVGGTAGQFARIRGARVIGIAGGPEKCALVTDTYGFDACIDYKSDGWRETLASALPNGLTVFFENVSADMAMLALSHARPYARGVLCGLVDAYHAGEPADHAINAGMVIAKRAQLSGLVVYDFYDQWDRFAAEAGGLIGSGELRFAEDRVEGLENAPMLFEKLMDGKNIGKAVVQVAQEQT